jgi:hypothetical protein
MSFGMPSLMELNLMDTLDQVVAVVAVALRQRQAFQAEPVVLP